MTAINVKKRTPASSKNHEGQSTSKQLSGLANLVLIQTRFRRSSSIKELAFVAVNDIRLLVNYESAVFFLHAPGQKNRREKCLLAASDVPEIDNKTPYALWLANLYTNIVSLNKSETTSLSLDHLRESLDQDVVQNWSQHASQHLMWIPILYDNELIGATLVFRSSPFEESEIRVLEYCQEALNYAALGLLSRPKLKSISNFNRSKNRYFIAALILLIVVQFLPINLTILAPAAVIAKDPFVVRSPLNGTIEKIHVEPNMKVRSGDVLVSLDKSALKTQLEIAAQSQVIVEAELHQAQQSAFNDIDSKSLIPLLTLKLEKSRLEVAYTKSLLERSEIRSERNGITIYSNNNELIGRPFQLGERIMSVADSEQSRLEIYLPVGDDIELDRGSPVQLFLAASPDKSIAASLSTLAYEAQDHEGTLVFKLLADFTKEISLPRIGQRGTVRIEGKKVTLFYYIFRRPIAFLRQKFGW